MDELNKILEEMASIVIKAYEAGYKSGKSEGLTTETAIDHLYSVNWIQEHDKIMLKTKEDLIKDEVDRLMNKRVLIRLKDGQEMKGILSCDSRYLQLVDFDMNCTTIFYGKDIDTIMEIL